MKQGHSIISHKGKKHRIDEHDTLISRIIRPVPCCVTCRERMFVLGSGDVSFSPHHRQRCPCYRLECLACRERMLLCLPQKWKYCIFHPRKSQRKNFKKSTISRKK